MSNGVIGSGMWKLGSVNSLQVLYPPRCLVDLDGLLVVLEFGVCGRRHSGQFDA